MAEMARNASSPENSENIGDVLASIRRLIAQDETGSDSDGMLDGLRRQAITQAQARAAQKPVSEPLRLTSDEMVAAKADTETTPLDKEHDMNHALLTTAFDSAKETAAHPQPAPAAGDDMNLFSMEQRDMPDEAPLRGLIRDALVQEMQGELGTRMTRNLRQLIRSEITAALKEATRSS